MRILVATDFSTRSDAALRRAARLAGQWPAELVLLHVVDDDQPARLADAARREAAALLDEMAADLRRAEGIACSTRTVLGDLPQAIADTAEAVDAALVILGPHRPQALRDAFVGTTVERTIRTCRRPVIMAAARPGPAGAYRRILVATDFSEGADQAALEARALGLLEPGTAVAFHAFDAPGRGLMLRAAMTEAQLQDYMAEERARARSELAAFVGRLAMPGMQGRIAPIEGSVAGAIWDAARGAGAGLVVVGTRSRSGLARLLLGSVAEDVLRHADPEIDVLTVPPTEPGPNP